MTSAANMQVLTKNASSQLGENASEEMPPEAEPVTSEEELKGVPHNTQLELSLLTALLYNNDIYTEVSKIVLPEHFCLPINRLVYEKIETIIRQNRYASPNTLWPYIKNEQLVQDAGGEDYIRGILHTPLIPVLANKAVEFAQEIRELSIRRKLMEVGTELSSKAGELSVDENSLAIIDQTESKLFDLRKHGYESSEFKSFTATLVESVKRAKIASETENEISGYSTGLIDLDGAIGGLHPTDLVIIAGRPGMGKTALATNIAHNVAKNYKPPDKRDPRSPIGGKVAIFSLEMSAEQLGTRLLSETAGIPATDIRLNRISPSDFSRYAKSAMEMVSLPIYIDDTPGLNIADITLRAGRLHRKVKLDLVFVDYIQLIRGLSKVQNRNYEIAEITGGLKNLAKKLEVPVIGVSQLSRSIESRTDQRPQLSDLRDSGSIEQDADQVIFVYREEYYLRRAEPSPDDDKEFQKWKSKMEKVSGKATLIIDKNRHGPVRSLLVSFQGKFTKFGNIAHSEPAGANEVQL